MEYCTDETRQTRLRRDQTIRNIRSEFSIRKKKQRPTFHLHPLEAFVEFLLEAVKILQDLDDDGLKFSITHMTV